MELEPENSCSPSFGGALSGELRVRACVRALWMGVCVGVCERACVMRVCVFVCAVLFLVAVDSLRGEMG